MGAETYIGIDLYIDSDIQISSSARALHPSCYRLNVACDLSERRLLINAFAGPWLKYGWQVRELSSSHR